MAARVDLGPGRGPFCPLLSLYNCVQRGKVHCPQMTLGLKSWRLTCLGGVETPSKMRFSKAEVQRKRGRWLARVRQPSAVLSPFQV